MTFRLASLLLLALVLPALASCGDDQDARAPAAQELSREAIGHYCNMIVADHQGPKGQIYVADRDQPVWFSSVRDTIAFTLLPEEPKNIVAIYVNDMGRASWEAPEPETWIEARGAWYVIESSRRGGMGAPEAAPFSTQAAAEAFAAQYGGRVVTFSDIPASYILGEVGMVTERELGEIGMNTGPADQPHAVGQGHDEAAQ